MPRKRTRTKSIDYEENIRWFNNQPESYQHVIDIHWKKYIRWKDPYKQRSKEERQRMRIVFIEAVVIGILDIG